MHGTQPRLDMVEFYIASNQTFICNRAQSGSPEAGEKSLALLQRMEVLSRMDKYDVRPDTISYNTCIKGAL